MDGIAFDRTLIELETELRSYFQRRIWPLDEKRFANNPQSVERVSKVEPEFVHVSLDDLKLPP
jgi:hypothetical protein